MEGLIIVKEVPKNCESCKRSDHPYHGSSAIHCNITGLIRPHNLRNEKPKWCPIKEMPKEKDYSDLSENNPIRVWGNGWNACIETIRENR